MDSRLQIALSVYAFSILGLFLALAPWSPMWDASTLVFAPTRLGDWLRSGWFRGAVSGLGVVDLLVAASESVRLVRALRGVAPSGEGR